jgi:hypothetical protein
MERTKLMGRASIATAALAFVAILGTSIVLTPLAMASSPGSDYPIEIVRAHTEYRTGHVEMSPSPTSFVTPSPSPDVKLIGEAVGTSSSAQMTLLQAAYDL